MTKGFVPPAYPYDLLNEMRAGAVEKFGAMVDCSIGAPVDAPPAAVIEALSNSNDERGYPPANGRPAYRQAAVDWMHREFGVTIDPVTEIGAAVGTKEFVAGTPHFLKMRRPDRDTILYPAISYPSYEMGATFAGCRAVPVGVNEHWGIDIDSIDPADAARAVCLWINTPGNPAGGLDDLDAIAEWGRTNDVLILSDECYIEFTWDGPGRTILSSGMDGVIAVHSLSKRSNLAGVRAGFYAGDPDVVKFLQETRKHGGMIVPGPVQAAAVAAWNDQSHVVEQRAIYRERLEIGLELLRAVGAKVELPRGGFYLWAESEEGDGWALARRVAEMSGVIVSPGDFYGDSSPNHVRFAAVQPTEDLRKALERAG